MLFDYEILRLIWWAILGILLIGFTILDGFVLGSAMLLTILGRKDNERRIIINSVAPVWESNQVWLILAGGASFAAWPFVYSLSFSGFYFAIILALFAIIIRPVGFKFRSKSESRIWRSTWDFALTIGGFIAPLIFGVAFGNLFLGVPFYFDQDMRLFYTGGFFDLLVGFPLLCGLLAIAMMMLQGATYIYLRTENIIQQRARNAGKLISLLVFVLFAIGGIWIAYGLPAYEIISTIDTNAPSSPIMKDVVIAKKTWLQNFYNWHIAYALPLMGLAFPILTFISLQFRQKYVPFITSSITQACIIATAGVSLFPFLIPSSLKPNHSLTVWDASSSQLTLFVMLLSVIIFLPIVLVYVSWVYKVMGGKVTDKVLEEQKINAY